MVGQLIRIIHRTINMTVIVKKPLRNSAGFCGGGQGLNWAVEPRKEELIRL
jgi:hypothetical protein